MKTITHNRDAAKTITLNSLKTEGALRIYEIVYNSSDEIFNSAEAKKFREDLVANNIHIRELTNQAYRDDSNLIEVEGFMDIFEVRYINPRDISYSTEVIIYNDTVAFYSYGAESKGIEIVDEGFAKMQKQIFDQLWRKGSKPVSGKGGRSSLI